MANWREGYEIGYRAALRNVNEWIKKQSGGCQDINVGAFMDDIGKDSAGGPSITDDEKFETFLWNVAAKTKTKKRWILHILRSRI